MRKVSRLFLVRHGNTFNVDDQVVMVGSKMDLPLTTRGHQQAECLATYFTASKIVFDKTYCGQLTRQKETARTISDAVIENIPALNELDYGPWEGLTDDDIQAKWPQAFQDWSERGIWQDAIFGIPFASKQALIKQWLDDIPPGETILAVSSGGIIRLFLSLIPDVWQNINFKAYKINTGNFCELLIKPEGITIVHWNKSPI